MGVKKKEKSLTFFLDLLPSLWVCGCCVCEREWGYK